MSARGTPAPQESDEPVELPAMPSNHLDHINTAMPTANNNPEVNIRPAEFESLPSPTKSDYYEDIDPRFAEPPAHTQTQPAIQPALPSALQAGVYTAYVPGRNLTPPSREDSPAGYLQPNNNNHPHSHLHSNPNLRQVINLEGSYEDLPSGNRSPAMSTSSHFTSISQRGVNPNWKPAPGEMPSGIGPPPPMMKGRMNNSNNNNNMMNTNMSDRQAQALAQQTLLAGNPDFEIPGVGPMGPRVQQRGGMGMGMRGDRYGGM